MGMTIDVAPFIEAGRRIETEVKAAAVTVLLERGNRIADRARANLPPGGMQDAIAVQPGDGYVDVGVIPGSGKVTESGASVDEVAVPLEFGHLDFGVHVPPHPFLRPAIAAEMSEPA